MRISEHHSALSEMAKQSFIIYVFEKIQTQLISSFYVHAKLTQNSTNTFRFKSVMLTQKRKVTKASKHELIWK